MSTARHLNWRRGLRRIYFTLVAAWALVISAAIYRAAIRDPAGFHSHFLGALALLALPPLSLYALALLLGWIGRGFQTSPPRRAELHTSAPPPPHAEVQEPTHETTRRSTSLKEYLTTYRPLPRFFFYWYRFFFLMVGLGLLVAAFTNIINGQVVTALLSFLSAGGVLYCVRYADRPVS